jgi:hypothetical protein
MAADTLSLCAVSLISFMIILEIMFNSNLKHLPHLISFQFQKLFLAMAVVQHPADDASMVNASAILVTLGQVATLSLRLTLVLRALIVSMTVCKALPFRSHGLFNQPNFLGMDLSMRLNVKH